MSADLVYVSGLEQSIYVHFTAEGDTPRMNGYTVELFIPDERKSDIDRNETLRKELSEIIKSAIDAADGE